MVSATFFPNSRFEFLSKMFNQCFIFTPILSFELVEALVHNYAYTKTNKNICLCRMLKENQNELVLKVNMFNAVCLLDTSTNKTH